ncbi:MAG: alpha/beta hydrolase-fold protein [Planctomycetota bacterium]
MNRLEAPALSSILSAAGSPSLTEVGFRDAFEPSIEAPAVATFQPVHYEPGYAYPLVVWLHDTGQTHDSLPEVMTHISTRNYVAVAPAWEQACDPWREDAEGIALSEKTVLDAVDAACERFNVHGERIFLIGAGRGGTAALRIALSWPDTFAGAASLDGPAPRGNTPLGRINRVRGLPVMISTGDRSDRYAESTLCEDVRLLYSAGCNLNLRHEPGDGDVTTSMLADLNRWMMDIVCASASPTA